ncbi:MAG: amidophosphoribosyltransferase [Rhodospirillaceae bacterium]|jgi:amidophosphoribosyltransferase|nr:amidophosphoribosyltransferase [Rhodospirillaceae bacterium]MBT5242125.1 amidophosphoribosyltransferase [Rhodospirillaceae bacterium]MBT5565851.1 amidophosphoribosyltransferase [Rhodospirillaceae bacterium]MBT6088727.1 amidophosphoribosyltransferase [Rhodospirillaceae bacterium]MBT6961058.1 amidophosphoribosyltransferase [Rhodospirillaceae bacterium]
MTPPDPSLLTTDPLDGDTLHEECGVFGIYGDADAASHTALGLHALQHRGQEASGLVTFDGEHYHSHRGLGHVSDNFKAESVMSRLQGSMALGHNRYSTTGETILRNVQPLFADFEFGGLALGHNGNLTNALTVRQDLVRRGCIFQSTSDTEVVIHLIAISQQATVEERVIDALRQIEGAYSMVAMTNTALYGVRDPLGVRPLVIGKLDNAYILCSETCALDIIGAAFVRDVEPGEMVIIDEDGLRSVRPFPDASPRFCIFEYIYFARPDSVCEGSSVYEVRKRIGEELARESHVPCDVIVPVPDSGVPAALGYAAEVQIPFEYGIIRNHYVGRTFIQPTEKTRHLGVKRKHNINRAQIEGKRVVLVDDSIVRGTTSTKIVDMVRQAGAKEVHLRISSPPTAHPCYFGIDTPERDQLLAAQHDVAGMAKRLGVDSLAFISVDGLYRAVGKAKRDSDNPQFCDACFTGEYPSALTDLNAKELPHQLSLLTEGRA